MIKTFSTLLFVGITTVTIGQDRFKLLDQYFDSIVKHDQGMGSIAILQNGKEQYKNIYGFADKENQKKATVKTKYRIGSISKVFTAVCVMQLVDEGRIRLNQKLSVFFPELPNADKIDLEQLLRHRSGLHNFTDDDDFLDYLETEQTREDHLKRIIEKGVDFEPGLKYSYSNTNYVILSFICEDVDQLSYNEVLSKRITKPLKLKKTYHANTYDTKNKEALSYFWAGEWQDGWKTHGSVSVGAGSLVSTVSDLNKFMFALENEKLLSKPAYAKMREMKDAYGLGLMPIPWGEDIGYGHTGGIDAFVSVLAYFPEHDVYVAFCGNGIKLPRNQIVLTCLEIYANERKEIPNLQPKPSVVLDNTALYVGNFKNEEISLSIEISGANGELTAQATGQTTFPLTAVDNNTFIFDPAGVTIRFSDDKQSFILEQGGGKFVFTKVME